MIVQNYSFGIRRKCEWDKNKNLTKPGVDISNYRKKYRSINAKASIKF